MFSNPDEALKALIPFVIDDRNLLWDGGLIFISQKSDQLYEVELSGFYYPSEQDRKSFNPFEKQREINFNEIHKTVFTYLQHYYGETNPR